jgi:hypothetical protein
MSVEACPDCGRQYRGARILPIRCICGVRFGDPAKSLPYSPDPFACVHRGPQVGRLDCGCQGNTSIYSCGVHGECMIRRLKPGKGPAATCNFCDDRQPK